jgi:hypothetical protein
MRPFNEYNRFKFFLFLAVSATFFAYFAKLMFHLITLDETFDTSIFSGAVVSISTIFILKILRKFKKDNFLLIEEFKV